VVPPTEPCALRSTQPLKVSTRDFSCACQCVWLTTCHPCSTEHQENPGPNQPRTLWATVACCGMTFTFCFVVGSIEPFVKQDLLKMVYHSLFHSIMNYGKIFWGNSPYRNSISRLQKRIIRIIVGSGIRDSCREFSKILFYH